MSILVTTMKNGIRRARAMPETHPWEELFYSLGTSRIAALTVWKTAIRKVVYSILHRGRVECVKSEICRNECFVSARDTQVLARHSLKAGVGVDNDHGVVWTWDSPISKIRSCPRFQLQLTTVVTYWEWSSVSHQFMLHPLERQYPRAVYIVL